MEPIKIIEDLSKLFNIEQGTLSKLLVTLGYCIAERVYEDVLENKTTTEVNIEFATLTVSNVDGKLKIKLTPNEQFLNDLKAAESRQKVKLVDRIEKYLINTLNYTYKELI